MVIAFFKKFENLIFVDDKLPVKTTKIMSLRNLYAYIHQKELITIRNTYRFSSNLLYISVKTF